jgi:hypothetical protein
MSIQRSKSTGSPDSPRIRDAVGAWFSLTSREQTAVALILGLALLGLITKFWYLSREEGEPYYLEHEQQTQVEQRLSR